MTQEEKELLLKDLCARLPYGVKLKTPYNDAILVGIVNRKGIRKDIDYIDVATDKQTYPIRYIKPYLRPLSSMTEEESKEFESLWNSGFEKALDAQFSNCDDNVVRNLEIIASSNAIDSLNKKMFAYRTIDGKDMFELGIAIKAPERMYNIKEQ